MKKKVLALAVFSVLASGSVFAAPAANDSSAATLNFGGKVTASLCQVSTADLTKDIDLGEVSKAALDTSGKSPAQSFSVTLNNCDTSTANIDYVFSDVNGSTNNAPYLEPKATDTSASGVGVFLAKPDGTKIDVGQNVKLDIIKDTNGTSALPQQTIPLQAYIGKKNTNAGVTAGTVDASAILTIRATAAAVP